ncbi:unnamed protein product [Orchesella dallaii]
MEVAGLKAKKKLKKKLVKSIDSNDVEDEPKKKKKKKVVVVKETDKNEDKLTKLKKKKKLLKAKAKEKVKKKKKAAAAAANEDPAAPAPHKSLMELLELEYRAKAIKALLRSQGQTVPDIPLNIDENSNSNETVNVNTKQVEQSTATVKSPLQVNGSIEPVSNMVNAATTSQKPEIKTVKPTSKPARPLKSLKEGKSLDSVKSDPPKVNPNKDESSKKIVKISPVKAPPEEKEKPKKAVIDLIDEALNTSFSEEADVATAVNNDAIKPLPIIAEACAHKNIDSEALRNKLLQKYQKQKLRKKKKKESAPDLKDQEDILDLHPQELSLTDEDQAAGQNAASCTENETSEYSESEPEDSNPDTILEVNRSQEIQSSPSQNKEVVVNEKATEDEELNYDEDSLDEVVVSTDKVQTDELSQSENMELDNIEDSNSICQTEESLEKKSNEPEDTQMSGGENTRDAPLSENSRSEMFSETTRDDVFEGTSANSAFTQSLKRKITFRIDPSRIGVLEEQGAEEEARKAEERKLDDVVDEDLDEEKEVEEGEIDSNEEGGFDEEEKKATEPSSPVGDKKRDLRDFLNRKHSNKHASSDDDSDASQDSNSYNVRRTSYRKASGTDRERELTHSPKRTSDKSDKNEPAPKRPSSPVEFITQFSDMEPISDDSDHSGSRSPRVTKKKSLNSTDKNIAVQGCAEKPSGTNDKMTIINSTDKEQDQVKDISNATNEDSQESVASDTPSKSSIVEKADSASGGEEDEDELRKPVTWYERWAQSHGMQKVAKTNKIHKKVRTKMKQDVSAKKKPIDLPKEEPSIEAEPIIGSIEEYEKLFGKKVVNSDTEPADTSNKDLDNSAVEASNQVDNNDDDDADDLWGDILGGS